MRGSEYRWHPCSIVADRVALVAVALAGEETVVALGRDRPLLQVLHKQRFHGVVCFLCIEHTHAQAEKKEQLRGLFLSMHLLHPMFRHPHFSSRTWRL